MKYLIGNWKSNQNISESLVWLDFISKKNLIFPKDLIISILLPFTDIGVFNDRLSHTKLPLHTGSQNVSSFPPGKHTGEITASMLSELVEYCLVGHSERRNFFNESIDDVTSKTLRLQENNITPIVCLDDNCLEEQIKDFFRQTVEIARCLFVYEPLSAIGTGKPLDPALARQASNKILFLTGHQTPVLYGGSVTSENVKLYTQYEAISGVLVGAESLDPEKFSDIILSMS